MAEPVHQLDIFYDDLPYKPYCADYLDRGLDIYPKRQAIGHRYIQGNQPCLVNYLFFDLDHEDSVLA
ncbi:plasmid replicase, partial [Acinetobacter baumannii]|nr:plasmid replicase [Acinetobacter baumannii]